MYWEPFFIDIITYVVHWCFTMSFTMSFECSLLQLCLEIRKWCKMLVWFLIFNGTGIIQGQRNYSIENSQILLIGWEMATISLISYVSGQKNPGVGKSCAQGWYLHILSLTLSKVQNQGMNPAEFFFIFLERIITCWEASLCSWKTDEHVYEWRIHAVHKVCQTFQICVLVHFKHLSLLPCVDFETS